jgi:hypothetical protein
MFKKKIVFCVLSLVTTLFGKDVSSNLINSPSFITDVSNLLQITRGITIENPTLTTIVQATKENWKRNPNLERWQLQDIASDQKKAIIAFGDKYNFFKRNDPNRQHYDYVFLLGGAIPRMEKRINCLIELFAKGITCQTVFLLASTRPLDPKIDTGVPDSCKTEAEACSYLWKRAKKSDTVPWKLLIHPEIPATKSKPARRASTEDTYALWLKQNYAPGSILIISSQPFCNAQRAAAELVIPKKIFPFEVVGPGVIDPNKLNGNTLLDTFNTWINFSWQKQQQTTVERSS